MLIITGRSCSGKDTIVKELVKLGYKRIITYATRPMREGEVNDVDYHFITTNDFLKKYIDGEFLEVNYYTTCQGIWFYGSAIEDYKNADKNTICILTPSGVRKLKERNIKQTSFLIDISDDEILRRQVERGDDKSEAERRFYADKKDFTGYEDLFDYVINNENRDVIEVAKEIDMLYKRSLG